MITKHFTIQNHGSVILLEPLTEQSKHFVDNYVADDLQWWGKSFVCEPGYFDMLVDGFMRYITDPQDFLDEYYESYPSGEIYDN
tara:strand:+ start:529 stop:780 length:252 start_codon:yes stop_codon:yes gene_type:complete